MTRFLLAALLVVGGRATATAQVLYDYLARDVTADIIRKNQLNANAMIDRLMTQYLMQNLAMQDLLMLQNMGQARIKSGQASLLYEPTEKGSLQSRLDPASRPAAEQVLAAFGAALRDKRMRVGDIADCRALGLVMAYYGYRGEDPGPERLARVRADLRAIFLADLAFQGMTDPRRQGYCERAAFLATLSASARNEALRLPNGTDREPLIRRAEQLGAEALRDLSSIAPEGIELTPTGFGDRGERLAREGGGSTGFRRGPSAAAAAHDAIWGAGVGATRLTRFAGLVRQYGGSADDLADTWATAYAWLLHFREEGRLEVSRAGWTASRDYLRRWAQAQASWMRTPDDARQRSSDDMAIAVAKMIDERDANRRQIAEPPPTDPIKRTLWVRPIDLTKQFARDADELIRRFFVASEQAAIERLLRS